MLDARVGRRAVLRIQRLARLHGQCVADLVEPVCRHGIVGIGAQHALVQRAGAPGAIQLAGGQRLLRLVDQIHRVHLRRAGTGDRAIEPVDVAAAAEQFAGYCRLLRGLAQLAGLQRGIGLRQHGLADLAQAVAGAVVVRLQRRGGLEQFARAGAVLAVQTAILQGLLRLHQHRVEVGSRQHPAQTVLVEPEHADCCERQQQQDQGVPAAAMLVPPRPGRPGVRPARFDRYLRQAVHARRARSIQPVEVTQGGLGANRWMCVVLVSASAHDPWL